MVCVPQLDREQCKYRLIARKNSRSGNVNKFISSGLECAGAEVTNGKLSFLFVQNAYVHVDVFMLKFHFG